MPVGAILLIVGAGASPPRARAQDALVSNPDGVTVYDTAHHVTWLADFNLPATNTFGLPVCDVSGAEPCVNAGGSMSFPSAVAWVDAMNRAHYLGHADWRLPTTPSTDPTCPKTGQHGNSFGFGCTGSALGSLYYTALGLTAPDTAVPIPDQAAGSFHNFQPYLYWSGSSGGNSPDGFATFSFNTGFQGANTAQNYLYVLPMIPHAIAGHHEETVFDSKTRITWPADANLAASMTFDIPFCTAPDVPKKCINQQDGSMTKDAADEFIVRMKSYKGVSYLDQPDWQLPAVDPTCPSFGCRGDRNPLGNLYYDPAQLGLTQGTPVVATPDLPVGPFHNVQPYLYWACQGESFEARCHPGGPAPNFEWSFSFGSGFLGTDILQNNLYVTAYHPGRS
jgi:hypothetical protein